MLDFSKYLSTPLEVTWDITRRCNLQCAFCLENADPVDALEEPEETRRMIVDEIVKCRVLKVNVSGGEPFIIPELESYVETLSKGGVSVTITSNGLLITKPRAQSIHNAGVRRVEVTIYPQVRDKSFQAIKMLREAGVKVLPRAVFTRQMAPSIGQFLDDCVKNEVGSLVMQEVIPQGRALKDFEEFTITQGELDQVTSVIKAFHRTNPSFELVFTSTTLGEREAGCAMGCVIPLKNRKRCEIRPDGNVIPCFTAMVYGITNSILHKGLKQCWLDIPELYKDCIESSYTFACSVCSSVGACPGGCPAEHETRKRHGFAPGKKVCSFFGRDRKPPS